RASGMSRGVMRLGRSFGVLVLLAACSDDASSATGDESSGSSSSSGESTASTTAVTSLTTSTTQGTSADSTGTETSAGSSDESSSSASGSSEGAAMCGNDVVDPGESCDGSDLDGSDCAAQGFVGGALGCRADCTFDYAA